MIDFAMLEAELPTEEDLTGTPPPPDSPPDDSPPQDYDEHGNPVKTTSLPPIEDTADFVELDLPEPPQVVTGLIHQGTKVMVGGGSKSFKTWIQLDLSLSVAYGLPWMGRECHPGRVLFVNLEIQREFFQRRIKTIAAARGITLERGRFDAWNLRGKNASYHIILPQIIERIKTTEYSLIDLDPIYKLYGKTDENSASEVASLMNELERVCVETKGCVTFGAHYSKGNQSSKEAIDRVSGSGVFTRDPDSIINFTPHEEAGSFVVECILRNLPPIEPFVVTWNYPLMERNDDLDPSKLKQLGGRPKEHDAATLVALIPESGLSDKELGVAALKSGMSRATFYRVKTEAKQDDLMWWSEMKMKWMASKV